MKYFLSEKSLVLLFCGLFVLSALFLFWQNQRELDPDRGQDWWALSFADPQDPQSLAFRIDNHTKRDSFAYEVTYEVTADKVVSTHDTVTIAPGESTTITPDMTAPADTRVSIIVTAGTETKQIYR